MQSFCFFQGLHGESKLSTKQNIEYVQQLITLYWAKFKIPILILLCLGFMLLWQLAQKQMVFR